MTSDSENDNNGKDAGKETQKPKPVIETKPKPSLPENVSIRLQVDIAEKIDKSDKK